MDSVKTTILPMTIYHCAFCYLFRLNIQKKKKEEKNCLNNLHSMIINIAAVVAVADTADSDIIVENCDRYTK